MDNNLFVIFGATGNLTYKKLLPALNQLLINNSISRNTKIVCIGRRDFNTVSYIEDAREKIKDEINWDVLKKSLHYYKMDITMLLNYLSLKDFISVNYKIYSSNAIFYLATGPELFPIIANGISEVGLVKKGDSKLKVVFEKPFGEDLVSAKEYNDMVRKYFDERQIYRIDHYLGKEMIQNILVVRFANKIFEEIWSSRGIRSVTILAKESEGVMNRGGYYDKAGALRDMVQNHLMQMLSLIAMEPLKSFEPEAIRKNKVQAIQKLKLDCGLENLVVGQYKGYRKEKNVDPESKTETFVFLKAKIDTKRWEGVPFYMLTGKNLDEKKSEIIIEFLESSCKPRQWSKDGIEPNKLIIRVAPEDGITFQMNTKTPGLNFEVRPATLDYCHKCKAMGNLPEAYEKLLLDIILGDSTLFPRWDEIEYSWQFIDQVKTVIGDTDPVEYNDFSELEKVIFKGTKR
jgi:glucose-6-phosphate 1-dehydrogenase